MHSFENRFVIGTSDILFAGMYVSIQPGNFTGCGSEAVKHTHTHTHTHTHSDTHTFTLTHKHK